MMLPYILFTITNLFSVLTITISLIKFKNKEIIKKELIYLLIFTLILVAFSFAFLGEAIFTKYGYIHITMVAVCLTLPFTLKILIKKPLGHKIVLYLFTLVVLILTLVKFTFNIPFFKQLPLNICNLVAVFIIIRPIFKNKALDNYILCFAMLGGIMNSILGMEYSKTFYNMIVMESNVIHNLYFSIGIYLLITKEAKADIKAASKNFIWLIPYFIVMVFLNQIHKFNFFFTSKYSNPIVGIYNLFPTFNITLNNFVYEINLIYYVIVIGAAFIIQLLFSFLYIKIQKRIK